MALHRLVAVAASRVQDRKWVAFIPLKRFGNDISAPVAASINTAMKGVVSEQTRRKGDIVTNSMEALKKRADASFKKDERVREGTKAMLDYEAEGRAVREKTARLRALRLDKEAAEKNEGVAADSGQPLGARKKANHGC